MSTAASSSGPSSATATISSVATSIIPPFQPASDFVPAELNGADWEALRPLYTALVERELHCRNCLQRLLLDRSELDAAASEAFAILYTGMTCHTDDAAKSKSYSDFVERVQPELKRIGFELDKKIVNSVFAKELDKGRYAVLLRDLAAGVELFRPENIELQTQESKLEQEYQTLIGAMSVEFDGKVQTLPQMGRYQELTDRAMRESAWRAVAKRRLQDAEAIEALFDKLVTLRQQIARNAGFASYRDYAFKARRRFDYTVADCSAFAEGVLAAIVPATRRLTGERVKALGLEAARPWDMAVDVRGRPPLRPFSGGDELFERSQRLFNRMDPGLGELFAVLKDGSSLDLDSRAGKAPGGYQMNMDRKRVPFIFMNAAGLQRDVETMVHEAGHAFHALLARADPLVSYRADIPIEFCEVASMSMELTSHPFLDEFYSSADAARAKRVHLEGIASILCWIATIDQFQHWIYTNIGHTRQQRRGAWVDLMKRFGGGADWTGVEQELGSLWHRQAHLFTSPFYYIEYGIAQLGAIQLYGSYKANPKAALDAYKSALSLGGSKPLPELFAAAGLRFEFSPERITSTWAAIEADLAALPV